MIARPLFLPPIGALLLSVLSLPMTSAADFQPDRQVVYKTIGDVELDLHIFEPESHQETDQAPSIVFFFGGGWASGTPRQFFEQSRYLADRGMVAIAADYRVKSRHGTSPFECVADGKSAIRWVRANAKKLGVSPEKIVAAGGSAGGHVAACTGVIREHDEPTEDLTISSIPNALILFNPVLDTTDKGYGLGRVGVDRQYELSPCHHVRPNLPPTLIFHGTDDKTVPHENPERFTRLMKEAGNDCQLKSYPGAGHGFFNGKFFRPSTKDLIPHKESMAYSIAFLNVHGLLDSTSEESKRFHSKAAKPKIESDIIIDGTTSVGVIE